MDDKLIRLAPSPLFPLPCVFPPLMAAHLFPTFLLFLLTCFTYSLTTDFVIYGMMTCGYNRPFTYQIQILEKDPISADEKLSKSSFQTTAGSPAPYNITGKDYDDGPLNHWYEIALMVYHDCGIHHKRLKKEFYVGEFWVRHGRQTINFDFDLTDKGQVSDW